MSQYNKTVLTHAGLELAKKANAGQAKFGITRAVTSADDWSNKTVQDLEEVTTVPNIMQQGTIMDTDEVESNNSVIGVSLCFTNKNLSTGYQIRIIGLYVKEEGQENDFLYAVTTAITPEYMPSFADKVLYRFNTQMYLVIGNAQSVNVVINDGTAVTHGQLDKYKAEVTDNLKKLENTHKEDMSHVAKSASINGGAEILPDSTGKLNLVVPDPDLSKYVSLEQLGELLQAKANVADVNKQIKAVTDLANTKANTVDVDSKIKIVTDLANTKANSADVYTKTEVDNKTSGTIITDYDIANKNPTKKTDSYRNKWLVDQNVLGQFADQINQLKGRRTVDAQDFNNLTDTGTYYVSNPSANSPTGSWGNLLVSNGDGHRTSQLYFPDDNSAPWYRTLDEGTWHDWTQLASASQVTNAQNTANSANTNANGRLSLGGGNMSLRSTINWNGGHIDDKTGNLGGLNWAGATDWAKIYGDQDDNDNLDLAIDLGDDGSNHVSFRKNGSETSAITSDGHFTGTVDWGHVNGRPQDQVDRVNTITPLFRQIQNSNNWNDIFGVDNPNNVLTSLRINDGGSGALLKNYASGIGFGGGDTKGVLNVAYSDHTARIIGGNGNAPVWHEDIAWKSDISNLQNIINQQNQTIQSLTSRLNNAENEINYIKANYVEGRTFPASQEAQANSWENANPQRLAFITK